MMKREMKAEDVLKRVEEIRAMLGDDEVAHSEEDRLHRDVLSAIADGHPDAAVLAAHALKTLEIPFSRWCA